MKNDVRGYSNYQTGVLFIFSFLTASTYVFVRALAISLFLARAGVENLPIAFTVSAFVVIGVSLVTRQAVRHLSTFLTTSVTWVLLAGLTIAIGLTLGPMHHSLVALSTLYMLAELRGCLNTIFVVTLSNDLFENTNSKQPYAIVASGAPVAGILVGTILGLEATIVSLMPAVFIIVVLDGLTVLSVWLLKPANNTITLNATIPKNQNAKAEDQSLGQNQQPQKSFKFNLAALVSFQITVLTLVGYQWKVAAGNYFGSNEAQLLAYFAIFYAISDTVIVLLQWLVSGRLMDRLGIGIGLIGFPFVIFFVGLIAFLFESPLALLVVFTLGKGMNVLRRALHDPGLTIVYSVIDPLVRPGTIVFVKGVVKPFAEAVSACLLLLIGGAFFEFWITALWCLLVIPWLYFAIRVTILFRKKRRAGDSQ